MRGGDAQDRPGPEARHAPEAGPCIVVILLTLNQKAAVLRAVESLLPELAGTGDAGGDAAGRVHVLVWDNGSTDGTAAALRERFPAVLVHAHAENLGVAGGRNAAARLAMERYDPTHLLFLDNDVVVTPGFVSALYAPFGDDPLLAQTQAKLRFLDRPDTLNYGGGVRVQYWLGRTKPVGYGEKDEGQRDRAGPCVACGGATMVRADVFRELGGFDEIYNPFGPEDLDFSLRAQKRGYRALYVPAAVAYHAESHTFEQGGYSELYAHSKARNWIVFMRRHAPLHARVAFFTFGVPIGLLQLMRREGLSGGAAALRGWVRGAVGRRSSPSGAAAGAREADARRHGRSLPTGAVARVRLQGMRRLVFRVGVPLVLAAASTLAGLALAELGLRALNPQVFPSIPPGMLSRSASGLEILTPGFEGVLSRAEFRTTVRIGPHGFRGPGPGERRENTFRVMALGDSQTFGFGVEDHEAWPARLQQLLSQRYPHLDVQVINAGVPGYATADEWVVLNERGAALRPDVVVLQFLSVNDFEENQLSRFTPRLLGIAETAADAAAESEPPAPAPPRSVAGALLQRVYRLKRRSHLATLVSESASYVGMRLGLLGGVAAMWGEDFGEQEARLTQRLLVGFVRAAEELGSAPLLLYSTGKAQVIAGDGSPLPSRQVFEDAAAEAAVPWVDLTAELRERPDRDDLYYRRDGHWAAPGHEAVAEIVAARLEALRLIPGPGARPPVPGQAAGPRSGARRPGSVP